MLEAQNLKRCAEGVSSHFFILVTLFAGIKVDSIYSKVGHDDTTVLNGMVLFLYIYL